jgi:4-amino-4-deoxy-L-arabinose transferase-like glycosyltransferase
VIKKYYNFLGLSLYIAVILVFNACWIKLSYPLTASDVALHNANALFFYRVLTGGETLTDYLFYWGRFSNIAGIVTVAPVNLYPPLVYLVTALSFLLASPTPQVAGLSLQIFTVIFILGLWACARELWGNKAAWAAVLMGGTSPLFLSYSRIYFLEAASAALVCTTLYFFLKSQTFTRKKYCLMFGVSLGLGLLTRQNFIYYTLGLILWALAQLSFPLLKDKALRSTAAREVLILGFLALLGFTVFFYAVSYWNLPAYLAALALLYLLLGQSWQRLTGWAARQPTALPFTNLLQSLAVALALAGPWYISAGSKLQEKYSGFWGQTNLEGLGYYLEAGLNAVYPALLLVLLSLYFYYKDSRARSRSLLLWFALGLSCITLTTYKDCNDRYLLPALPYLILGLSYALEKLKGKTALAGWIIIGLISLWQLSGWVAVRQGLKLFPYACYKVYNNYYRYPPLTWLKCTPLVSALPREGSFPIPAMLDKIYSYQGLNSTYVAMVDEERSQIPIEKDYFNFWAYANNYPYFFGNADRDFSIFLESPPFVAKGIYFPGGDRDSRYDFKFLIYNTAKPATLEAFKTELRQSTGWKLELLQRYFFAEGQYFYLFKIRENLPGISE